MSNEKEFQQESTYELSPQEAQQLCSEGYVFRIHTDLSIEEEVKRQNRRLFYKKGEKRYTFIGKHNKGE